MAKYISAQDLLNLYWESETITNALIEDLGRTLEEFQIITPNRIQHFISQATHECDFGRGIIEYADGTEYKGRIDLGNTQDGDGPRFRGAGIIHLTGRYNYQKFSEFVGDPRVMEGCYYVAEKYPCLSGGYFWTILKGLNAVVDRGASVAEVTVIVNGGYNGLDQRQLCYERAVQYKVGLPTIEFNEKLRVPGPEPLTPEISSSYPFK